MNQKDKEENELCLFFCCELVKNDLKWFYNRDITKKELMSRLKVNIKTLENLKNKELKRAEDELAKFFGRK